MAAVKAGTPNITSVVTDDRGMVESSVISQCSGHSMNFQTDCKTWKETKPRRNCSIPNYFYNIYMDMHTHGVMGKFCKMMCPEMP